MRKSNFITILSICLFFAKGMNGYGQEKYNASDIKGIWVSTMQYVESSDDYASIEDDETICFGFTESKGKINNGRYTGLYRKFDGSTPKLLYYDIDRSTIILYDSSDNRLSYSLEIETLVPKFSMTATLIHKGDNAVEKVKMIFMYHEKGKK